MAVVASLNVLLGMNTGQFSAGAKQANAILGTVTKSVTSMKGAFAGVGLALSGRKVFGGFMELLKEAGKLPQVRTEFDKLNGVFAQVKASLAAQIAPALVEVTAKLLEMTKGGQFMKVVADAAAAIAASMRLLVAVVNAAVNVWSQWGGTIIKAIAAVVAFRVALATIVTVQKAIATAQAIVLALSGPKGWAQLAVGAAIAVGAVAGVNTAFASIEATATKAMAGTAAAVKKIPSILKEAQREQELFNQKVAAFSQLETALEDKLNTFGFSDFEKQLYKFEQQLANIRGPVENNVAMVEELKTLNQILESKEAQKRVDEELAKLAKERFTAGVEGAELQRRQLELRLQELKAMGATNQQLAQARGLMQGQLAAEAATEGRKRQAEQQKQMADIGKRIRDQVKTPLETLREAMAEITKARAGGQLNADQAKLAQLQAQRDFLGTRQQDGDTGHVRPAALERNTAAAFSASFGQKAVDKTQADMLRVEREILEVQRRIEKKMPIVRNVL